MNSPKENSPPRKNHQFPKSVPITRAQTRHSGISSRIPGTTLPTASRKTRDNSKKSNSGLNSQTSVIPPPYLARPPRIVFNDADPLSKLTVNPPGTYSTDLNEIIHSKYRSPKLPLPPLKPIVIKRTIISFCRLEKMKADYTAQKLKVEDGIFQVLTICRFVLYDLCWILANMKL